MVIEILIKIKIDSVRENQMQCSSFSVNSVETTRTVHYLYLIWPLGEILNENSWKFRGIVILFCELLKIQTVAWINDGGSKTNFKFASKVDENSINDNIK